MKLIYCGSHDAVRVPLPGGGETTVANGGELDTSDTHGRSLLDQPSNWKPKAEDPAPKLAPEKGSK